MSEYFREYSIRFNENAILGKKKKIGKLKQFFLLKDLLHKLFFSNILDHVRSYFYDK